MDEQKTELKPCPKCGGKAVLDDEYEDDHFLYYVRCNGDLHCVATKSYPTEQEAIDDWNTRPGEDALRAEVERLRAALEVLADVNNYFVSDTTLDVTMLEIVGAPHPWEYAKDALKGGE